MKNLLSCAQVLALIDFYIADKLNSKLRASVDSHLKNCTECRRIYSARNVNVDSLATRCEFNSDLVESLSAYIDNALDDSESVRVRKIMITNPIARKKLEDMYTIRREMNSYFNKIKNECRTDYSKDIIGILSGEKSNDSFNKLVWAFTAMLCVILAGFITMLYF